MIEYYENTESRNYTHRKCKEIKKRSYGAYIKLEIVYIIGNVK